jgi:hypothetical protein
MSRLNVRRLTAGLLLAALLGLAAPAIAAPAGRPLPTVALGSAWIDQVLEWIRSFWPGEGRGGLGTAEKGGPTQGKNPPPSTDVSSTADPNGGTPGSP